MAFDREGFKNLLKKKGLKVTKQRLLVLQALASCPDKHLTAEEIYTIIKADCPEIGLATVYRTIQLLLELNLIDRINLDDGFVRYEIGSVGENDSKHHHHHLIKSHLLRIFLILHVHFQQHNFHLPSETYLYHFFHLFLFYLVLAE